MQVTACTSFLIATSIEGARNLAIPDSELVPKVHARLFAAGLPRVAKLVENSGTKASEAK